MAHYYYVYTTSTFPWNINVVFIWLYGMWFLHVFEFPFYDVGSLCFQNVVGVIRKLWGRPLRFSLPFALVNPGYLWSLFFLFPSFLEGYMGSFFARETMSTQVPNFSCYSFFFLLSVWSNLRTLHKKLYSCAWCKESNPGQLSREQSRQPINGTDTPTLHVIQSCNYES